MKLFNSILRVILIIFFATNCYTDSEGNAGFDFSGKKKKVVENDQRKKEYCRNLVILDFDNQCSDAFANGGTSKNNFNYCQYWITRIISCGE